MTDHTAAARALEKRNRIRRSGQITLEQSASWIGDKQALFQQRAISVKIISDSSPTGLQSKVSEWQKHIDDPEYENERLRCDAWITTWIQPKTNEYSESDHPLDVYYDAHFSIIEPDREGARVCRSTSQEERFFHWTLEFPEVFGSDGTTSGFDAILGNPPWIAHAGRAAQPVDPEKKAFFKWENPAFAKYPSTHGMFLVQAAR